MKIRRARVSTDVPPPITWPVLLEDPSPDPDATVQGRGIVSVHERRYATGDIIFAEGDVADVAFVVRHGSVEISKRHRDGQVSTLAVLGPRDLFGEMGLFDDRPRSATARAQRETVCYVIPKALFLRPFAGANPWVSAVVLGLVKNLRRTNRALLSNAEAA